MEAGSEAALVQVLGRVLIKGQSGGVTRDLYHGWNVKSSCILPLVAYRTPHLVVDLHQ